VTHDPSGNPFDVVKRGVFETKMFFVTVLADAEMCRDLMLHNRAPKKDEKATNRKRSERLTQKYAFRMIGGEWEINPQPIIFSEYEDGILISELNDGQHRLEAVILADKQQPGIQVPLTFCFNAPSAAMWVVDQGKNRVPADWLAMFGETHSMKLSHSVTALYALEELRPFKSITLWRASKLSPQQQQAFLNKHPDLRYAVDETNKLKTKVIPYVAAVLYYMMHREYGNWKTQEFFKGLASGANLDIDDPRLKVREFLAIQKQAKHKWDGFEQLGLLIAAVNAWLMGAEGFKARGAFTKTHKMFPELIKAQELPTTVLTPGNDPATS